MKPRYLILGLVYLALILLMAWYSQSKAIQWSRSEEARQARLKREGALPAGPTSLSAMQEIFNPNAASDPRAEAMVKANALTENLLQSLGSRLKGALQEQDPAAAVQLCADVAQPLTAGLAQEPGVVVRRTSLRARNAVNKPDEFERNWLELVADTKAKRPALVYSEVVPSNTGAVYRQLTPIYVKPLCLQCHGDPATIAPEVRQLLQQKYPDDRATGYAVGDFRGAVSVSIPLGKL